MLKLLKKIDRLIEVAVANSGQDKHPGKRSKEQGKLEALANYLKFIRERLDPILRDPQSWEDEVEDIRVSINNLIK